MTKEITILWAPTVMVFTDGESEARTFRGSDLGLEHLYGRVHLEGEALTDPKRFVHAVEQESRALAHDLGLFLAGRTAEIPGFVPDLEGARPYPEQLSWAITEAAIS